MLNCSLNKLKKRAIELDLNLVFTEEDAKQEEGKEEEEEEEYEEEEGGEEQRQNCTAGGEDLYLQKETREVLGFGEPGGIGTSAKEGIFRQECDDKDSTIANDWNLNLEVKERESTAIQASSPRGCIGTGEHQLLREERLTDYLELCEKQDRFSPKRCIMDGLEEGHKKQGSSSVTVEKDCCNFRDDGLNLNLEEKSHYRDDGACKGDAMEPAAVMTTTRRTTRSQSLMSPTGKKRYAHPDADDAFRSRKHRPHHYHHRKSAVKTMLNNDYAWAHAHSLVGEGDPFSRRLIVEQDHLRSPRECFSRTHIEQNLSESPPRGYPSSARPIIKPDHHDSRSPRHFPANQHYQDLSPSLLSLHRGSQCSIRDSLSRSPPRRYQHSHRTRYSPQGGNSQRRQSPQNYKSKKQPWTPPPNRNNGIGTPGRNLFIAGFSFNTTERDLERKFSLYGHVQDVRIVRDKGSGNSRGFGFLSLGHDAAADEAIRNLDRSEWNGRIILVEKAKSLD